MVLRPFDGAWSRIGHIRIVLQSSQHLHGQIMSDLHLAGESQVIRTVFHTAEALSFRFGHRTCVAVDDLDAACRASRVSTTPMQYVDAAVFDRQHETPAIAGFNDRIRFDNYLMHSVLLLRFLTNDSKIPAGMLLVDYSLSFRHQCSEPDLVYFGGR